MPELRQIWTDMVQNTTATFINVLPRVVGAILLLIVALLVAKLIERIMRALLTRMRFDALLAKAGLDQTLQRIGIRESINRVVPRIVYFLLLVIFAQAAADALGMATIAAGIGAIMAFLPNLFAALLILVLGSAAAQWAGQLVTRAADSSGIEFAGSLGRVVSAVLIFVLGIVALSQLRIDTDMVRLVSAAVLAGLALAFGLSLGLGSRDITRTMLAGYYARKSLRIGEEIEVLGHRGVLRSITPTQTLIEHEGKLTAVSNNTYLESVVHQ